MDSDLPVQSADVSDTKPSFRKPSNDAANRKYRRHSPAGGSDSSLSDGSPSPKHERGSSPVFSKEDHPKMYGSKTRDERKYYDGKRSANYSRHRRDADEGEKNYFRTSRSGRESRSGNSRYESSHRIDKYSRDDYGTDRRSRDKSDSRSHRTEYHRQTDRNLSSDRTPSGGQYEKTYRGDVKNREQDQYPDRAERAEKRDGQRSSGDYEHDRTSLNGRKGHAKDSRVDKDSEAGHRKETYSRNIKEGKNESIEHKRKHDEGDYEKRKDRFDRGEGEERRNDAKYSSTVCDGDTGGEQFQGNTTHVVEESLSKKHKPGHLEKPAAEEDVRASPSLSKEKNVANGNSGAVGSTSSQAEVSQDFNAAKIAAMKAAELVNKNLTGCGFLSTAQKKKLLWGNKKNEPPEESGNRWDLPLFSDRERQEKFNKLMSLSLPWCLWGTVGRERGDKAGSQAGRQPPGGEGEGAPDGLGEAVHRRAPPPRRKNRRPRSVTLATLYAPFLTRKTSPVSPLVDEEASVGVFPARKKEDQKGTCPPDVRSFSRKSEDQPCQI